MLYAIQGQIKNVGVARGWRRYAARQGIRGIAAIMLNWMFNRQKSKDDGALDAKSAAKLRDLAETVRSIAPDEFGAAEQANSRAARIPRKKDSDDQAAQSGID